MTEQEIAELDEAYKKAVLNGTANTQEWADRMADSKVGVAGYTAALRSAQKQLKDSMVGLGKSMMDGETGASVFNDGIKAGADRLDLFFIKKLGPAGMVLGKMAQAAAAYIGAVNKQADSLYKSFQDISRTGTIGHGAMRDVYGNMQKFGYGVKELDKFGSLMAENSQTLAQFGGNAVDGAKAFANMASDLQHSPVTEQLLNMGISVDEINRGAAGFIKQQASLGRGQKEIGDKLASGTLAYINELENISRLTGQTRKEQEDKIADAMAEQAFNAKIGQLKRQEESGDAATREMARRQREKLEAGNQIFQGEMRKEFIRGAAGDVAAMGTLTNLAGGEIVDAITNPAKDIGDVVGSVVTGFDRLNESGGENLAMMNAWNGTFPDYYESQKLAAQYRGKNAKAELEKAAANKNTTDSATKNMTATEIAQRKARDNMQDFINFGINPVTKVMEILAKAIEWLTDLLPGAGKAREQYEMEKKVNSVKTAKVNMENEAGERVDVTPETAERIKANKAKGIKEGTKSDYVPPPPSVSEGKGWDDNTAGTTNKTSATPSAGNTNATSSKEGLANKTSATPSAGNTNATSSKEGLANKIMSAESGGRNIANKSGEGGAATSSAFGLFQFTKGTFEGLAKSAKEGSALYGKTFDDYKKDTNLQREAMNVLMDQNAAKLSSRGLGTSDANMYLAHFLGAGGAAKALGAGPSALLTDVMSPEQLSANPSLKSMKTVADLQAWAEKKMGGAEAVPSGPTSGYKPTVTAATETQPRAELSAPKVQQAQKEEEEDTSKELMAAHAAKLNDIVRAAEKLAGTQQKILQRTNA